MKEKIKENWEKEIEYNFVKFTGKYKPHGQKLNQYLIDEIIEQYNCGCYIKEIVRLLGIHINTVRKYLRINKLTNYEKRNKITKKGQEKEISYWKSWHY